MYLVWVFNHILLDFLKVLKRSPCICNNIVYQIIKEQIEVSDGACEYALYVQGMILRNEAQIQESLESFQAAAMLNPNSLENLKQVSK